MKQKSTKTIASVFFNLTIMENLLKAEGNEKVVLMLRACEEGLYNAMLDESEIDTFRVELDKIVGTFKENAQKAESMSKISLAVKNAYSEKRLKKLILESEKRRGV